jgi:hypothetical protein
MPLNVRTYAVNISVMSFFFLSIVGWISGISPFICCKRAMIGAAIVYIVAIFIVRVINIILLDAIINRQVEKGKSDSLQKGTILEAGDRISGSNN